MRKKTSKKRAATKTAGRDAFRSLLVPVDLTAMSDRVLARLSFLEIAPNARVALLHVVPESLPPADRPAAIEDAEHALSTEARLLRRSLPRTVRIDTKVDVGPAASKIAAAARRMDADLIVMGRGGRSVLRDVFLGSIAERVIRMCGRPVLVVRLAARGPYRRPALALDLDHAADEVVRLMLRAVPPPRPLGTVVHAVDEPYQGYVYPSLSVVELRDRKTQREMRAARRIEKVVTTALERAGLAPGEMPEWQTRVLHGAPRAVVAKAVERAKADLLVLGTHGRGGLTHLVLGSVAGDLLRAVACDVLVVPPRRKRR